MIDSLHCLQYYKVFKQMVVTFSPDKLLDIFFCSKNADHFVRLILATRMFIIQRKSTQKSEIDFTSSLYTTFKIKIETIREHILSKLKKEYQFLSHSYKSLLICGDEKEIRMKLLKKKRIRDLYQKWARLTENERKFLNDFTSNQIIRNVAQRMESKYNFVFIEILFYIYREKQDLEIKLVQLESLASLSKDFKMKRENNKIRLPMFVLSKKKHFGINEGFRIRGISNRFIVFCNLYEKMGYKVVENGSYILEARNYNIKYDYTSHFNKLFLGIVDNIHDMASYGNLDWRNMEIFAEDFFAL
ncbi:MAG: hypothetical protein GF364_15765 [Candidatus Lokiarchaeota archaeon]|nr:hypothetical protein [Candidatus Lokiarchaeota archaeon]